MCRAVLLGLVAKLLTAVSPVPTFASPRGIPASLSAPVCPVDRTLFRSLIPCVSDRR